MIDRDLELQVRGWFAAEVPVSVAAPQPLRTAVRAIPRTVSRPVVIAESRARFALLAAAAAIVVLATIGALLLSTGHSPTPSVSPASTPSPEPASASWARVSKMLEPRAPGVFGDPGWATPLADGRVLVAGGEGLAPSEPPLASAEIFDPATDSWTATGAMTTARLGHTLTLLADGRVLAAGGMDGHDTSKPLSSAELFDPATGRWSPTGSMAVGRTQHIAVRLLDGRVLVAGGDTAAAELYDPATGRWASTGSMTQDRWLFAATRLSDGRVLVEGSGHLLGYSSAELFDPAARTWTRTTPMAAARGSQRSILLPDDRVLVVGGQHRDLRTLPVIGPEIYDPVTATWEPGPAGLAGALAVAPLADGKVLVTTNGFEVFIFDPADDGWTATAQAPAIRDTAIALGDGRVLVFGDVADTRSDDSNVTLVFSPRGQP
jgi:hypothetical protein